MELKIEDYITLPVVNEAVKVGEISEKEAVSYITDCAAAKYFVDKLDDSSDDAVEVTMEDETTKEPEDEGTETTDEHTETTEPEDQGIATGTEDQDSNEESE